MKVWDANPKVEAALKERGRLWHREDFDHSVSALLALPQPGDLPRDLAVVHRDGREGAARARAASRSRDTRWIPSWGQARIDGMIANRPDWCISRQRVWGVPIPAMDCTKCGTPVLTKALVDKAASVFDVYGADSWYERPIEEFIPDGMTCAACGGTEFEREGNILDVWFDSGSSHEAVLPFREDHHWPADIYLEGSDQHRGWFHSSLLVGVGTRGRAPFNQVLTHGFVMDENGRKMSKSLGNTTAPQDVIKQSGSEILRLWVTMVDYRYDINLGKEVLARTVESYRKFRNVIRVLVANLYDFDPKDDAVPKAKMLEIDRWVLAQYADAAEKIVKAYEDYDYPAIFQIAEPVDHRRPERVLRRRDEGSDVHLRREVRSAPLRPDRDVHHRRRPGAPARAGAVGDDGRVVADVAGRARRVGAHGAVPARSRAVEGRGAARTLVGAGVRARSGEPAARREAQGQDDRREPVGARRDRARAATPRRCWSSIATSCRRCLACRRSSSTEASSPKPLTASSRVERATGTKCERCWRYVPEVSAEPDRTGLCPRCVEALAEPVSL